MSKKRPLISVFIACEGRNTEPIYFERVKEDIEEDGVFALTIYPNRNNEDDADHHSDPIGLVKEAQSRAEDFDELWVVFDKNGYTRHPQAFDLAQMPVAGKIVNIGFSSIAFEQWVLLHFRRSLIAYTRSQQIVDVLRNDNLFPHYEKRANVDIYPSLKSYNLKAIENAAWLRMELEKNGNLGHDQVYQLNPYTNIDKLLVRLLNIPYKVQWQWLDHSFTSNQINYKLIKNDQELSIFVDNQSDRSIVWNAGNVNRCFSIRKGSGVGLGVSLRETTMIEPEQQGKIDLRIEGVLDEGDCLIFENEDNKILFEL